MQIKTLQLLPLFFLVVHTVLFGQYSQPEKASIVGTIIDAQSQMPLEFATVSIMDTLTNAVKDGTITDKEGKFSLPRPSNEEVIVVEFISYKPIYISKADIDSRGNDDLGIIQMYMDGETLTEVQVVAEKSNVQFALDKRVFNVGKDLNTKGGTAQDVLENIPSVTVGVEGDVQLRGSSDVRILIDGRPSGLVGIGDANGLRALAANQIERIEVITNPGSRYEAEGMGGIINIILKKDRKGGFNGSFEVTGGAPITYGAGANLNYRARDINFFTNYNFRDATNFGGGYIYQEIYESANVTIPTITDQDRDRRDIGHNLRGGLEYFISDKQSITASILYNTEDNSNINTTNYYFFQPTTGRRLGLEIDPSMQYTSRIDDESESEHTTEFALDYTNKFNTKGHELTASFSYQDNREIESSNFTEDIIQNGVVLQQNTLLQRSSNNEGQNNIRLQVDYTKPLSASKKIETGALVQLRQIDNDFRVEDQVGEEFIPIASLTNEFLYNEDVLAYYGNWNHEKGKWSYQIGLRGEYSIIQTELKTTNEVNDNDYLNLFPSSFVNYKFTEATSVQLSYSRRIRRPRFWDLNPFFTFSDRRTQFSGNPALRPEYTDSYEVGFLQYFEKGNLNASLYYRNTTDVITRLQSIIEINGEPVTLRRPQNLGSENNIGLEINGSWNPLRKIRFDGGVNGFRFSTNAGNIDESLSVTNYTYTVNLGVKYTFWRNADLQMRLNHRGAQQIPQGRSKAINVMNLAFNKDFLSDNMSLTISVNDVFNQRRRVYETDTPAFYEDGSFQWRGRTALATLSYRLNMKKSRNQRREGGYDGGGEF